MTRLAFLLGLALTLCAGAAVPAKAYDESVHHALVYALARANGFSVDEAQLIADASQSADENDTTTTFSMSLFLGRESGYSALKGISEAPLQPVVSAIRDLPHVPQGQVWHATASPAVRETVERAHIARLRALREDTSYRGTPQEKRRLELVYLGQYLHLVADMVVHPTGNPIAGHAEGRDLPDRPGTNERKLYDAVALVNAKLVQYQQSSGTEIRLQLSDRAGVVPRSGPLHPDPRVADFSAKVAQAILKSSWNPSQSMIEDEQLRTKEKDPYHVFDKKRMEITAKALQPLMRDAGYEYRPFREGGVDRKIYLDRNGEPQPRGYYANIMTMPRSINVLPMRDLLEKQAVLVKERTDAAHYTIARAAPLRREAIALASSLPRAALKKRVIGPGGIALAPSLNLPSGIGSPQSIELGSSGKIVLVTSRGQYELDDVDPQSLALVLHTLHDGEIPFVTIGTEPSREKGYVRVTYAKRFENTREGAILFRADRHFKAFFGAFPFAYSPETATQIASLVPPFPRVEGDFTRIWITSESFDIELSGSALRATRPGIRFRAETTFRGEIRRDQRMQTFVAGLTARWDELKKLVWEFGAVEKIAIATAWAFYVKEKGIDVSPVVLQLPPKRDFTPSHARAFATMGSWRPLGISGGVGLAPETSFATTGRGLLWLYMQFVDNVGGGNAVTVAILSIGLGIVGILAVLAWGALIFWLIGRWAVKKKQERPGYLAYCGLVGKAIAVSLAAALILFPFYVSDLLAWPDREFLAFAYVFVLGPAALYFMLRRDAARFLALRRELGNRPWARFTFAAVSYIGGQWIIFISGSLVLLTLGLTGASSNRWVATMLSIQALPVQLVQEVNTAHVKAPSGATIPLDLTWQSHVRGARTLLRVEDELTLYIKLMLQGASPDTLVLPGAVTLPMTPAVELDKVRSLGQMPRHDDLQLFTYEGKHPFE